MPRGKGRGRRRINGRRVERDIYNNIKKSKPAWYVFRFNENRFNATPADLFISTPKYSVLIEVKATSTKYIQKANIRENQVKGLKSFAKVSKRNMSLVCLYYVGPRFVLLPINKISRLPSRITYEDASKRGIIVKRWSSIGIYLKKLHERKRI